MRFEIDGSTVFFFSIFASCSLLYAYYMFVLDEVGRKWVRKIPNKISPRLDTSCAALSSNLILVSRNVFFFFAQSLFVCFRSHPRPSLSFYSVVSLAREKQAFCSEPASRGVSFHSTWQLIYERHQFVRHQVKKDFAQTPFRKKFIK